jgi:hypothetical protein
MSLEMYNNAIVWSHNQIGRVDAGVAQLNVTMKDFVKKAFKFHEIQDIVMNLNEIIEILTKKGYQVEIQQLPPSRTGELRRSYDTWCKMIYG